MRKYELAIEKRLKEAGGDETALVKSLADYYVWQRDMDRTDYLADMCRYIRDTLNVPAVAADVWSKFGRAE